jgi:hypothetical protein
MHRLVTYLTFRDPVDEGRATIVKRLIRSMKHLSDIALIQIKLSDDVSDDRFQKSFTHGRFALRR